MAFCETFLIGKGGRRDQSKAVDKRMESAKRKIPANRWRANRDG
jgi:hypothetical protein